MAKTAKDSGRMVRFFS